MNPPTSPSGRNSCCIILLNPKRPYDYVKKTHGMSAKITRPTNSGAVRRKRLFDLLDAGTAKPVVWISSPAGSGKTTLVSSWLEWNGLPCIWYQCDEGDSDLATFFYYMGRAAKTAIPRYRTPLPLLTSEYLAGIPTFTRRYFETLCRRLASLHLPSSPERVPRGVIVLDNYQDVPADSPFHDMLANGFEVIPEGVHMVVISRYDPPPALARQWANDRISLLRCGDIRFTLEESTELIHGRSPTLNSECVKSIHEKADGWAAGITLLLEKERFGGTGTASVADFDYEKVFDYFAGELFNRTEKDVRDFLLKTAFLPTVSAPLAKKLTGVGTSGEILATLNRHHFFTERLAGSGQEYQYHPLFRDFLLSRAKTEFPPGLLAGIRKDAAMFLEQTGRTEEAARLYIDAGDRDGISRMITGHGRELLAQGRNRTLEEWIAAIPCGPAGNDPWLLYWAGMCSFPADMPRARHCLEQALESFRAGNDVSGIYLSWAGIVDTHAFGLDEWKPLDGCIAAFDELRKTWPSFPSRETDLIASSRMLISLTLRKTDRPHTVHGWLRHVSELLQESPSFDTQMDTMFCMSLFYLWKGEYGKNALLLDRAEAEIRYRKPSPFLVIRMKLMKGIHYWITAEYDTAVKTLSEGLEISAGSGVHVFDSLLWGFRAAAEMAPGKLEQARDSLENQMNTLLDTTKTLDLYFYHINSAWHALLRGDPPLADEHLKTVSARTTRMGTPYYRALWSIGMAQTSFLIGRGKEAMTHVLTALRIGRTMESQVMEWYALLIEAWLLLRQGKVTQGLLSLHRGLSMGRRHGYVHLEFYLPSVMGFLFAQALEEGIEPEYVKGLIRKLGLTPPLPPESEGPMQYLHGWPYPIRIYTLGRFEILRDDMPIACAGKEQKKPLELLKAVIAFGGRDVPVERLTDALWPDTDGDLAQKSFETTLGRLRRLLGNDGSIRHRSRHLSLDSLYCWVDSLALEQLVDAAMETADDRLDLLCQKAATLFRGPFLPADTAQMWTLPCRENLKYRLLRVIRKAGLRYEQAGKWDRACEYYVKGIETDGLAEEFYRRLIACHLRLGNNAEVVTIYNLCRRQLRTELGIDPSSETEALYASIMQKR